MLTYSDDHCSGNTKVLHLQWFGSEPPLTSESCTGESHRGAEDTAPLSRGSGRAAPRYMKELENLFEVHKLKYNVPRDQHLEIC